MSLLMRLQTEMFPVYLSDSRRYTHSRNFFHCTGFLKRIMEDPRTEQLKTPVLYGGIYDPEATLACKGKVGEEVTITFGAKFDTTTTQPITATGKQPRLMWKNGKRHQSLVTLHCFIPAVLTLFLQRVISVMFRQMYLLILEEIRRKQMLLDVSYNIRLDQDAIAREVLWHLQKEVQMKT